MEHSDALLLRLDRIEKSFGDKRVLRQVNLQLASGDVYGFLGRNGAGKSTTIRVVMGILKADAGSLSLFGAEKGAALRRARQRVGYVAQEQHFYPWMTALDLGRFVSGFYPRWDNARFNDLLKRFELPTTEKIGGFSGGMKARLALCIATATKPELLVLDEPTAGMDPVARREFIELVRTHAISSDSAVLFSTHVLEDIEAVANRVGILERGRIQYDGSLTDLEHHVRRYGFRDLDGRIDPAPAKPEFASDERFDIIGRRELDDRIEIDIRFRDQLTHEPAVLGGWRQLDMTLEDRFIAMVSHQW